ncbi:hypothetical protein B0J13DRAFT_489799 [Dactylonectria estremocensis]|uniref:Zn(2)-C6 fungal-type domain-containing protein n=1 Tax=Dactylonectria estremocensis TaxID=1079267 RepID=A0A9P9I8F1_9HYPO|nr:hypothetical protein B0J13DRAFT_489799 [Dactylonectria estremocensis]
MTQEREGGGQKRSSNQSGDDGERAKRRAPYALRACDACRRRKGKCDGRQPCRHCTSRGQSCNYNSGLRTDGWQLSSTVVDIGQTDGRHGPKRANLPTSCNQNSIIELLSTLQEQLDSVTSQVRSASYTQSRPPSPIPVIVDNNLEDLLSTTVNDAAANQECLPPSKQTSGAVSQYFYGPTSPDYSLNVAQLKLRQNSFSGPPMQQNQLQLATIDDETASDYEDAPDSRNVSPCRQLQTRDRGGISQLLQFQSLLGFQEAMRLLYVYQEVVGDLHPIVDLDELISSTQYCYADADSAVWDVFTGRADVTSDESLLILNLALTIALRADSNPTTSNVESVIRDSFQDGVNLKLATPACSIRHVTIILLKGWCEFFYDMPRSAWRMCGIAGRMLMELGFHNGEVSKHVLSSQDQHKELCNLMGSIVILDRQWSAATGLPTNFHESSFDTFPATSIESPYLKAMLSFIRISDKFSEPISQAAKGAKYRDEDAFEVMNFQIEQWRKKAVGDYSLAQSETWHTNLASRPPIWAILLNLRAESVRSLLLRPYFFSKSDIETSKKYLRPAAELVFNVVNVLYTLDTTTEIYRKQHPYYQHLLASASALAFLLIVSIEQNRATMLVNLPVDLADTISRSIEMATSLTTNYAKTSRAARRLSRRLLKMRGVLNLCMLKTPCSGSRGDFARSKEQQSSSANPVRATRRTGMSLSAPQWFQPRLEYALPSTSGSTATPGFGSGLAPPSDTDVESGWEESLRLHWPVDGLNNMFSESIF